MCFIKHNQAISLDSSGKNIMTCSWKG